MNDARTLTNRFFFEAGGMDPDQTAAFVARSLRKADGGELFLQRSSGHTLVFSAGKLETNHKAVSQGFGFRRIAGGGDGAAYAYSNELNKDALNRAAKATMSILSHRNLTTKIEVPSSIIIVPQLYTGKNPLEDVSEQDRIKILSDIDQYVRAKDPRVKEVKASIGTNWSAVSIIRRDGTRVDDLRPSSLLVISVTAEENGRREEGVDIATGRVLLSELFSQNAWKDIADKALAQADTALRAIDAPASEGMPVVIGNGFGGVLLHEAVGHGMEGDAAYKGSTVFRKELLGQRIASENVTVIDQGNIPGSSGALHFDDEGTPTQSTILIEKGVLRGYMHDSRSAHIMGVAPTGNGRRESFEYPPIPRMTSTFMLAGNYERDEIIASVDDGIYVDSFNGGQVDQTSGKYVFAASGAYEIKKGKIATPLKGVTLIGSALEAMGMVEMVGNDLSISSGLCGKGGQNVRVGLGQPTVKVKSMKIGGTGLG
jgi:TldD protein